MAGRGEQETHRSSSGESNEEIDDDELKTLLSEAENATAKRKQEKEENRPTAQNSRTCEYDHTKLGPERHENILKISKTSVLVLANTSFTTPGYDRKNTDEYFSILQFIDTFGYQNTLKDIIGNIVILNKMNFENITLTRAERLGFKNTKENKVNHLNRTKKEYKKLRDYIGNNPDLMTKIGDESIVDYIDKLSWSKEQIELLMDIAVEDGKGADALMVFVCSHGRTNKSNQMEIMDAFEKPIKVDTIIEKLSKCRSSCRMLFIHACRGDKIQADEAITLKAKQSQSQPPTGGQSGSVGPKTSSVEQTGSGSQEPELDERQHLIAQETSTQSEETDQRLSHAMGDVTIKSGKVVKERQNIEDSTESMGKPLSQPSLVSTQIKAPPAPPLSLESCGKCPNDCLVLYTTTRGFKSDRHEKEGTPFTSYFNIRLGELKEKCPNGIAFIPFLQMMTGELAREDVMGDLQMLTFDHSLCEMPVLIAHKDGEELAEKMDES